MNNKIISAFVLLFCFLLPCWVSGQVTSAEKEYTAFDMRSNGKIYVLVACMLIILLGLILYLIRLERKIIKLEKGTK